MASIIIVDDQATNRNLFSRLAKSISSDISVHAFADPIAALSWLRENTPDLIISDYKMPQMDGAELIRRIRDIPALTTCRSWSSRSTKTGSSGFRRWRRAQPTFFRARSITMNSQPGPATSSRCASSSFCLPAVRTGSNAIWSIASVRASRRCAIPASGWRRSSIRCLP